MAVVVDHCNGMLYTNQFIAQASYFSVSLFVLLSGISVRLAASEKERTFLYQIKKIMLLFLQYMIATFVLLVYYCHYFDLKTYISHVLNFSIQAPYYFLVFFFQLMMISPFLLSWNKFCDRRRWKYIWHIITVLFLCYCSSLFIRFTNILPVHGGGKYLFGGTYIILYYLGILFVDFKLFSKTIRQRLFVFLFSIFCWTFWWLMSSYGKLPFDKWLEPYYGGGFNPPSIQFMVFAIITLFVLYSFFSLLEEQTCIFAKKIVDVFAFFGRYTLHIFMYHLLVKDIIVTYFSFIYVNRWVLRVCVFIPMITFPAFAIWSIRKGRNYYRNAIDDKGRNAIRR